MAFRFCVLTLASDGLDAKYGTPSPREPLRRGTSMTTASRCPSRRVENGVSVEPIDDALDGLFNQERFLQLVRNFTAFDENADGLAKRIAKPHSTSP